MTAIGPIVYAFFEQHLKAEKGLSPASVRSYRDALRLFLSFVAAERGRSLTRTTVEDFTAERVRHFLGHLETCRGNHIRSRNQRLAGLHTFFNYLARQVPEALAEAERVAIAPYGCRAQTLLSLQMLFEESIDNRADGGHGVAPVDSGAAYRPNRSPAASSSSAVMVR